MGGEESPEREKNKKREADDTLPIYFSARTVRPSSVDVATDFRRRLVVGAAAAAAAPAAADGSCSSLDHCLPK